MFVPTTRVGVLHKYLYANGAPVMHTDPSGYFSLAELGTAIGVATRLLHITAIGTTIVQTVVDVAIYHAVYNGSSLVFFNWNCPQCLYLCGCPYFGNFLCMTTTTST